MEMARLSQFGSPESADRALRHGDQDVPLALKWLASVSDQNVIEHEDIPRLSREQHLDLLVHVSDRIQISRCDLAAVAVVRAVR